MNLKQLQEKRGEAVNEIKRLRDVIVNEDRGFTPEEERDWKAANYDHDSLTRRIDALKQDDDSNENEHESKTEQEARKYRQNGEFRKDHHESFETADGERGTIFRNGHPMEESIHEARRCEVGVGDAFRDIALGKISNLHQRSAILSGDGAQYLLTPSLSARVIDLARNKSIAMKAGAGVFNMDGSEVSMVKVLSDPTGYWVGEGVRPTVNKPTFGRLNFRVKKLGFLVKMSRELLEDSPNAASMLEQIVRNTAAVEIDRAVLAGSGEGEEPTGIANWEGTNGTSSASYDWDSFVDALTTLQGDNVENPSIIWTPAITGALAKLKESTTDAYLKPPAILDGISRYVSNQISSRFIMGDFRSVLLGVRRALRVEVGYESDDFGKDLVSLKCTFRGDTGVTRASDFYDYEITA